MPSGTRRRTMMNNELIWDIIFLVIMVPKTIFALASVFEILESFAEAMAHHKGQPFSERRWKKKAMGVTMAIVALLSIAGLIGGVEFTLLGMMAIILLLIVVLIVRTIMGI